MSEYQYYEFAAVDRPLTAPEREALRALSTRADVTATSFVNTYHWGDFRGDPRRLVEKYFDAFLYMANWGTRQLMLRLPVRLVDPDNVVGYCTGGAASAWRTRGHVVVSAVSEDEERDFESDGEGLLASILPVRAELLAGDERALYLLWLLNVQAGEVDEDVVEPPVPASLAALTGSQTALALFLRIDQDLIGVAAAGSSTRGSRASVAGWVAGLPGAERDALLVGLLEGDDPLLRAATLRRVSAGGRIRSGSRTAGELRARAAEQRDQRERVERDRRAAQAAEAAHRVEVARRERLAALAGEGEAAWARVAARIAEKKSAAYDIAIELLNDLEQVCASEVFASRVEALRREHARKVTFIERLERAGL